MNGKKIKTIQIPEMDERNIFRFWLKVDIKSENECWEWTGWKDKFGKGHFYMGQGIYHPARIACFISTGNQLEGICACHKCDNPSCCNPSHIFPGTMLDNTRDAVNKGRLDHKRVASIKTPKKSAASRRNILLAQEVNKRKCKSH